MLTGLIYSLVLGSLALALSVGAWLIITKDAGGGKQSVGSGFPSKALDIVFKVAVAVVFLAGLYMIADGVWYFFAFPR